jgi:hypothetical protein
MTRSVSRCNARAVQQSNSCIYSSRNSTMFAALRSPPCLLPRRISRPGQIELPVARFMCRSIANQHDPSQPLCPLDTRACSITSCRRPQPRCNSLGFLNQLTVSVERLGKKGNGLLVQLECLRAAVRRQHPPCAAHQAHRVLQCCWLHRVHGASTCPAGKRALLFADLAMVGCTYRHRPRKCAASSSSTSSSSTSTSASSSSPCPAPLSPRGSGSMHSHTFFVL